MLQSDDFSTHVYQYFPSMYYLRVKKCFVFIITFGWVRERWLSQAGTNFILFYWLKIIFLAFWWQLCVFHNHNHDVDGMTKSTIANVKLLTGFSYSFPSYSHLPHHIIIVITARDVKMLWIFKKRFKFHSCEFSSLEVKLWVKWPFMVKKLWER